MSDQSIAVFITNTSSNELPSYGTAMSAGVDLRADLESDVVLAPGQRQLIPTGLSIALPAGMEGQIRPRSGLAFKHGITVLNSPGTIDADYRGEVKVLLVNHGDKAFTIAHGERIAQLVVARYVQVDWRLTDSLDDTKRGAGGFGHTGVD